MTQPSTEHLEVKIAFLEHQLLELDALVRQMGDATAALRREVQALRDERNTASVRGSLEDERPPHHERW